jgi:hypothetical protein
MIRSIALAIAIVLASISISHASVRITEIAWMGTTESSFGEWFELYNDGEESVDLANWKLFEDGGEQLVFTFTKSIESKGYLVVERTTSTSPNPVPGVDDESGSFGGSGFSNTGENLVLKDKDGTIVESLNFISGWPAGSSETKETMQWDGASWVTAKSTPKAGLVVDSVVPQSSTNSGGSEWVPKKIEPKIELYIPKIIYTKVAYEYNAVTFLDYDKAYSGVFLWNMGDGTTYKNTYPTEIKHTYRYPGTYTISFAYYKNPYDKKPFLLNFSERTVIDPVISLKIINDKGFEFTNSSSNLVDISGWFVLFKDINKKDSIIEIPPVTFIAPNKSVIMPFSSFGISGVPIEAVLQTPERNDIFEKVSTVKNEKVIIPKEKIIESKNQQDFVDANDLTASSLGSVENKEISLGDNKQNNTKIFIFGVILFVVIILFLFINKFIASQEE